MSEKRRFRVLIKAFAEVFVEGAEDIDEAIDAALDDVSFGDFQHDEAWCDQEITTTDEGEIQKERLRADRTVSIC